MFVLTAEIKPYRRRRQYSYIFFMQNRLFLSPYCNRILKNEQDFVSTQTHADQNPIFTKLMVLMPTISFALSVDALEVWGTQDKRKNNSISQEILQRFVECVTRYVAIDQWIWIPRFFWHFLSYRFMPSVKIPTTKSYYTTIRVFAKWSLFCLSIAYTDFIAFKSVRWKTTNFFLF